jgi:hypothetical protein
MYATTAPLTRSCSGCCWTFCIILENGWYKKNEIQRESRTSKARRRLNIVYINTGKQIMG